MIQSMWLILLLIVAAFSQTCKPTNDNDCGACVNSYFFDGKCQSCYKAQD